VPRGRRTGSRPVNVRRQGFVRRTAGTRRLRPVAAVGPGSAKRTLARAQQDRRRRGLCRGRWFHTAHPAERQQAAALSIRRPADQEPMNGFPRAVWDEGSILRTCRRSQGACAGGFAGKAPRGAGPVEDRFLNSLGLTERRILEVEGKYGHFPHKWCSSGVAGGVPDAGPRERRTSSAGARRPRHAVFVGFPHGFRLLLWPVVLSRSAALPL